METVFLFVSGFLVCVMRPANMKRVTTVEQDRKTCARLFHLPKLSRIAAGASLTWSIDARIALQFADGNDGHTEKS